MEMTQLNTRIPLDLKRGGDEVLARFGRNASDVMRAVWRYMVQHQDLPECVCDDADSAAEVARKLAVVETSSNMVPLFFEQRGRSFPLEGVEYDALREGMYDDLLDDHLRLCNEGGADA